MNCNLNHYKDNDLDSIKLYIFNLDVYYDRIIN